MKKAFTLIELLIVIGILAVLIVTILITLNPSEAQKKARDVKRMKDLSTLQAMVLQWINDGNTPFCNTVCQSDDVLTNSTNSVPCNQGWLRDAGYHSGNRINLCNYSNTIPVDPLNQVVGTIISGGTVQNPGTRSGQTFYYALQMKGSDYEITAFQESKADAGNVLSGGDSERVIVGSCRNLIDSLGANC